MGQYPPDDKLHLTKVKLKQRRALRVGRPALGTDFPARFKINQDPTLEEMLRAVWLPASTELYGQRLRFQTHLPGPPLPCNKTVMVHSAEKDGQLLRLHVQDEDPIAGSVTIRSITHPLGESGQIVLSQVVFNFTARRESYQIELKGAFPQLRDIPWSVVSIKIL